MIDQNDIALERQIRLILSSFGNVIEKPTYYNFRCDICGDSKKSKSKKRGYILKNRKPWQYFCHNCGYKKPVIFWMKENYPYHYRDYCSEILTEKKHINKPNVKIANPTLRKPNTEKKETKHFKNIKKGITPIFAKAINFCTERKIPENIWKTWFVANDGMYKNRLIIPFFDNNGKVFYYQGRALFEYMIPKYLSRKGSDLNNIYNYYSVDVNKPVIVVEGCIDSLFIENSVAVTGVKMDNPLLDKFNEKWYMIDYDRDTDETKEKTIKYLREGRMVFCWKKFIDKYKLPDRSKWDINEVILYLNRDKFTIDELKPYFTNSIFDEVYFL
jgi:hypothetical protein